MLRRLRRGSGGGDAPVDAPDETTTQPEAPEAGTQTCPTCGAAMAADQDWCLECGAAAPGSLGGRPGWRAVGTITGLTALLVAGAAAAGYAAITDGPSAPGGSTAVAQVPGATPTTPAGPTATTPGTLPPGTDTTSTTPTVTSPSPPTLSPTQTAPSAPTTIPAPGASTSTPAPAPTPAPTPTPTPAPTTPAAPALPAPYDLDHKDVSTYDPYARPGAEVGRPGLAVDGKDATVWDVTVPVDGAPIGVGLLVDLGSRTTPSSIQIGTSTPGFKVEVYAARRAAPSTITSDAWQHVTDVAQVKDGQTVPLTAVKGRVRRILLWITTPAKPEDPRVAITEIIVRKG